MTKMLPLSRPKRTREELESILIQQGVPFKDDVILVGERGYYLNSMGVAGKNDVGIYDDAISVLSPDRFATFNANTDPSKLGTGLAMLVAGVYKFAKGMHKGKYDALRAYPEGVVLPSVRDGKKSTCSYINIHKGGRNNTFSEGCQTIPEEQYTEFIRLVYREMDRWEQRVISYVLVG